MKQILIGTLAGGVVLFVWQFLAWAVIGLHDPSFRPLANEDAVVEALRSSITTDGLFYFPGYAEETAEMSDEERKANMDAWKEKHKQGPIGMIIYHPAGTDPMMAGQFIVGFVMNLVAVFLAAWFLSRSTAAASTFIARAAFCGLLGVFASFVSYLPNMNWLYFPMDYTTAMVTDTLIGWLLVGCVLAAVVKAPKMEGA